MDLLSLAFLPAARVFAAAAAVIGAGREPSSDPVHEALLVENVPAFRANDRSSALGKVVARVVVFAAAVAAAGSQERTVLVVVLVRGVFGFFRRNVHRLDVEFRHANAAFFRVALLGGVPIVDPTRRRFLVRYHPQLLPLDVVFRFVLAAAVAELDDLDGFQAVQYFAGGHPPVEQDGVLVLQDGLKPRELVRLRRRALQEPDVDAGDEQERQYEGGREELQGRHVPAQRLVQVRTGHLAGVVESLLEQHLGIREIVPAGID
mmetsp:Transcript_14044/g.32668  ORF Transcript_14044/g.32668 Transcript_14044/m.32668 type:complete len:262 (+) Transcript_14044:396-1181(+)